MQVVYFAQVARPSTNRGARVSVDWGGVVDCRERPVKIGYSANLYSRMLTLSRATKRRIWLVAAIPGGRQTEADMHAMFAHRRHPEPYCGSTEWFQPFSELRTFIASLPPLDHTVTFGPWYRPLDRRCVFDARRNPVGVGERMAAALGAPAMHSG